MNKKGVTSNRQQAGMPQGYKEQAYPCSLYLAFFLSELGFTGFTG
jgi:hypothetical protein